MARNKYPEETVKLILEEALKLFVEKGYENTSIQDIINNLGGLSKGAIYHHFKSKEEIFEEVCRKISQESTAYYDRIRDDATKNGHEKLKTFIQAGYANPSNEVVFAMSGKILSDSKFISNHISEMYELVAPCYLEPVIRQGIADGSIQTDYPKELAEVLITLLNIWVNPLISKGSLADMKARLSFFSLLFQGMGLDLFDEDTIAQYERCYQHYYQ